MYWRGYLKSLVKYKIRLQTAIQIAGANGDGKLKEKLTGELKLVKRMLKECENDRKSKTQEPELEAVTHTSLFNGTYTLMQRRPRK